MITGSRTCTERQSCRSGSYWRSTGLEELFSGSRGTCQIDVRKVDCDYYELLEGNVEAQRVWRASGRYLQEYSWAEETSARLEIAEGKW